MKRSRLFAALLLVLSPASLLAGNVAIAYAITGHATVSEADHPATALQSLAWVSENAVIKTERNSSVTLAFQNGSRYILDGLGEARVRSDRLQSVTGSVRVLAALPALPAVAPIASPNVSDEAGATRIRALGPNGIKDMYPHATTATIASETVLTFTPQAAGGSYHVTVSLADHSVAVFETDTMGHEIPVPAAALRDGRSYRWSVTSGAQSVRGSAEFHTISAELRTTRELLRKSITDSRDLDAIPLLARLDRDLGLLEDARKELQLALRRTPGDPVLTRELDAVERQFHE